MIYDMHFRKLLILIALAIPAWAGVVEDVRGALAQHDFHGSRFGTQILSSPGTVSRAEYVEAYSWMARAALMRRRLRSGCRLRQTNESFGVTE